MEDYIMIKKMLQSRLGCDFRDEVLPSSLKIKTGRLVEELNILEKERNEYNQLIDMMRKEEEEKRSIDGRYSSQIALLEAKANKDPLEGVVGTIIGCIAGLIPIIAIIPVFITWGGFIFVPLFRSLHLDPNTVLGHIYLFCLVIYPFSAIMLTLLIERYARTRIKNKIGLLKNQWQQDLNVLGKKYEGLQQQLETKGERIEALENTFNTALDQTAREVAGWKVKEWKEMGFDATELEKVVKSGNLDLIRRVFSKYDQAVSELIAIRGTYSSGISDFDNDFYSLKKELDYLRVDEALMGMSSLRSKIENLKKSKLESWKAKLHEWSNRGYEVHKLRNIILKEYSPEHEKLFGKYRWAIEELEEVKRDISLFDIKGFSASILFIENKLKNLNDIEEVIKDISSLKAEVDEKVKEKMEKWIDEAIRKVRKHVKTLELG